jgi:Polyketide cyclase / dehydrase and lipid transport
VTVAVVQVQREHVFGTPLEDGFRLITDIDAWPSYWPGLVRVESGSHWSAPGDRARLLMRLLGREVLLEMTLRELVPDRFVAYDSVQAGLPDARHERRFRPVDGGFAYRIVVEYDTRPGPRGLLDRTVVRRGIDRAVRQTMTNLEQLL